MPKSCWGCGWDWKAFWGEGDLAPVTIDGEQYYACPDCLTEIMGQEGVKI